MTSWNEQDHPRVPGGKSTGGQFTSKGSSDEYEVYYSSGLDDYEKERFADSFEGEARRYLDEALETADDEGPEVTFLMKDGEPYAFFQGDIVDGYTSDEIGQEPFTIFFLGSCGSGGGTAALAEAIRQAHVSGASGLFLESSESAVGFYKKLGMHIDKASEGSMPAFYFTADELKLITQEYYKKVVAK